MRCKEKHVFDVFITVQAREVGGPTDKFEHAVCAASCFEASHLLH